MNWAKNFKTLTVSKDALSKIHVRKKKLLNKNLISNKLQFYNGWNISKKGLQLIFRFQKKLTLVFSSLRCWVFKVPVSRKLFLIFTDSKNDAQDSCVSQTFNRKEIWALREKKVFHGLASAKSNQTRTSKFMKKHQVWFGVQRLETIHKDTSPDVMSPWDSRVVISDFIGDDRHVGHNCGVCTVSNESTSCNKFEVVRHWKNVFAWIASFFLEKKWKMNKA